jgi:hypothetical protein
MLVIVNSMHRLSLVAATGLAFLGLGSSGRAALATGVTGFYYTGESTSGTALGQGANTPTVANSGQEDASWLVTYASTNGGISAATAYEGTSYVVNTSNSSYSGSQYPSPPWAANSSQAEWITAPGAIWANGSNGTGAINSGGDALPGYGVDTAPVAYNNSNSTVYVYTTTFTITSTAAAGTAITGLTLNLNVSADNSYAVFVNPASSAAFLSTSTAKYVSGANAYSAAPSAIALTSGFVVGVNTISVEVQNASTSNSYATNYSGVLVYGAGFIGIPEYGTWLPLAAAAALYGCWAWRRSRSCATLGLA